MIAAKGTAIIKPVNPASAPKIDKESISQTGCNLTAFPTNFGVRKFPSKI